ncbi:anti-sigma factor [Silvibacterium sp.]|uniref:anti-sigma factor n=1 Tax=Silvibacterium sp. TaxID=1964179 RepID=UPI0039E45BA8
MPENPEKSINNSPAPQHGIGFGWLGWVTAVVAVGVAAWLGNHNVQLQQTLIADRADLNRLTAQADHAQLLTDALTSPGARHVTLSEMRQTTQPTGHATYLTAKGALVFMANNLHPLKADKTYELWLIPEGGKPPLAAGLFRPDAAGNASVILPNVTSGIEAKGFSVTIEDAQGSATPTLPIVMSGY